MQAYDVHAIVIFPFRVEAENGYQAERILEAALPDLLKCGQLTQPSGASARFDASSEGSLAFDRLERRFGLCCLMPEQSPTDVVATISGRSVFRRKIA
jgi:hypothetical protein